MATWKKVIVSGSAAELAHVTASTGISAVSGSFGDVSASGTILAAKLDATAVSDGLAAAIVAEIDNDEIPIAKLAEDAVTVTAGTGLTGGGAITLGGSATVNVIGGDGITANANDIAIDSTVATLTGTQTLTNKSIDSDNNTITNIVNADIKAAAAIDATKIANGNVSNTEFQYLDGVTSAIQTQLNTKATAGFAVAMAIAL